MLFPRKIRADTGRVKTREVLWIALAALALSAGAQTPGAASALTLAPEDLRIEQRADGGYHLYIRAKPGLGSVLLTETTKDPAGKADNYAYRAPEKNPVNGDEKRLLDGKFLDPARGIWSLIDSTPEPDPELGSAFHIFLPWVVEYGYPWSRQGEVFLSDGTFVNIRAFPKPYADYTGGFRDNPYEIRVTQKPFPRPAPPPTPPAEPDKSLYMKETVRAFEAIAQAGKGDALFSTGREDINDKLGKILDTARGKSVDLVLCLDTTDSMKDDIDAVKESLPAMIRDRISEFRSFRLGLVLYKDYFEDYLTKRYDFTADFGAFTANVTAVRVAGGRDIPEAVYEALHEAATAFPWSAEARMIVLIGDAPPHPLPRGKIDRQAAQAAALDRGIEVSVIILPH